MFVPPPPPPPRRWSCLQCGRTISPTSSPRPSPPTSWSGAPASPRATRSSRRRSTGRCRRDTPSRASPSSSPTSTSAGRSPPASSEPGHAHFRWAWLHQLKSVAHQPWTSVGWGKLARVIELSHQIKNSPISGIATMSLTASVWWYGSESATQIVYIVCVQ